MQLDLFHLGAASRRYPHLYTLNCGAGRDSTTILCLLVEGKLRDGNRLLRPEDIDAVVFADTSCEWEHTYNLLPRLQEFCRNHGLRWVHLRKPADEVWRANVREKGSRETPAWVKPGTIEEKAASGSYHRRLPLLEEYRRFARIAVTCSSSCTDNHKVLPIRRMLGDLTEQTFGVTLRQWSDQVRHGGAERHRAIIGIAADEASRAINTGRPGYEWAVYPLLEAGIGKPDEQAILARHGFGDVKKSGCFVCPYQPVGWYWALRETRPDLWKAAVEYEATALARHGRMWVLASTKKALPEAVETWRERNPAATVEEVLRKEYQRNQRAMGQPKVKQEAEQEEEAA